MITHTYSRGRLKLIFANKNKNYFKMIILNKCYYFFILDKEYKTAFLAANVFCPYISFVYFQETRQNIM